MTRGPRPSIEEWEPIRLERPGPSASDTVTVRRIEQLHGALRVVALVDPLARAAGGLAERHGLRGCDAVHLAAPLAIDAPGELVLATWDRELAAAAAAEGRMVVPAR